MHAEVSHLVIIADCFMFQDDLILIQFMIFDYNENVCLTRSKKHRIIEHYFLLSNNVYLRIDSSHIPDGEYIMVIN